MKTLIRVIAGFIVLAVGQSEPAWAGPLEDGVTAYRVGDDEMAVRLLLPLARRGVDAAQGFIGLMYMRGEDGLPELRGDLEAASWVRDSAEHDAASGQYALGLAYLNGFDAFLDRTAAAAWFERAAGHQDDESADAALRLARLYRDGKGVTRDPGKAAWWSRKALAGFQRAAAHGDLRSQMRIGAMYELGEGVRRDPERARRHYAEASAPYQEAASRGDAKAQRLLGALYRHIRDVPSARVQAARWLRAAADQGDVQAQTALGLLYAYDEPSFNFRSAVEEDRVQAYVWLSLAAEASHARPKSDLPNVRDRARGYLRAEALAEAGGLIDAWKPISGAVVASGLTPAGQIELARLQRVWNPTPEQLTAEQTQAQSYDMSLGSPRAKVVLVEYGSASAPQVARFHQQMLPALKSKYIDTGRVRFVYRDFITVYRKVSEGGALLARCAGPANYFKALDLVLQDAALVTSEEEDREGLRKAAHEAGVGDAEFERCIADPAALKALRERDDTFKIRDGIEAAPTFLVNGRKLVGVRSLEELEQAIETAERGGE